MKLRLNIAIDDCNPLKGYRILGEKSETWLRELNENYGVKFTLFCPSNFHNQAPLSQNKEWVKELASLEWCELAAHGHYHMTSDPQRHGECEMLELDTLQKCRDRYWEMMNQWHECELGCQPIGFRPPGWLCHPLWNDFFKDHISHYGDPFFEYTAVHYTHNQNMIWNCKTFFGHDGIQQENISIHNEDMIMFQSHIAGKHNHNVWNEQNYDQLRMSLDHLFSNYEIEPKLLKECL